MIQGLVTEVGVVIASGGLLEVATVVFGGVVEVEASAKCWLTRAVKADARPGWEARREVRMEACWEVE